MSKPLAIDEFLEKAKQFPVLDVRTPAEFGKGHIPGAINLPLFSDEERVFIGTLYIQQGRKEAMKKGFDFVGPKMRGFIEKTEEIKGDNNPVLVHCWRGGMRSSSVAHLLDLYGFNTFTLQKGYKAFRNWVLNSFGIPKKLIVLGGKTGAGKTEILWAMENKGARIIDLEKLAHHKGSAFGAIGEAEQPTQEQFENDLAIAWRNLPDKESVWLEDESRMIGKKIIPAGVWERMQIANVLYLDLPFEKRVENLVRIYGEFDIQKIEGSINQIQGRLGNQAWKQALDALHNNDAKTTTEILLNYYDKAYQHGIDAREKEKVFYFEPETYDVNVIAGELLNLPLIKEYANGSTPC